MEGALFPKTCSRKVPVLRRILAITISAALAAASLAAVDGGAAVAGTPAATSVPFAAAASGEGHALALSTQGSVYAWGRNDRGQLGTGGTDSLSAPTPIQDGALGSLQVSQISAGQSFSLALTSTGRIFAWGANDVGQLGDGSTTDSPLPVEVARGAIPSTVTITRIAAGWRHALALGNNGVVYAWGQNSNGELGSGGTSSFARTPVAVVAPQGVTFDQISAGESLSVARAAGSAVGYAWGLGTSGQLGNGGSASSSSPVAITMTDVTKFQSLSAGRSHVTGISQSGGLYVWGSNSSGEVKTPTGQPVNVPTLVGAQFGLSAVVAGDGFSIATVGDRLAGWGLNATGQLGNGGSGPADPYGFVTRGAVPSGVTLTSAAPGSGFVVAVGSDAGLYSWGSNSDGQLGNGATGASSLDPVVVAPVVSTISPDAQRIWVRRASRSPRRRP